MTALTGCMSVGSMFTVLDDQRVAWSACRIVMNQSKKKGSNGNAELRQSTAQTYDICACTYGEIVVVVGRELDFAIAVTVFPTW
jgi:hypothetical protein